MKTIKKSLIFSSIFVLGAIISAPAVFAGTPPSLQTNPATGITQTSATLNGYFNSNGTDTNVWFQYGNTPLMSQTTQSVVKSAGTSGNYSETITVTPGQTIYFRAFGDNLYGPGFGTTFNFTAPIYTLGTVQTNPVTNNTSGTSATLNGYVNGNGAIVSTQFEYGTTYGLGSTTVLVVQPNIFGSFSEVISTSPNTTYYFRAISVNADGVKSYGTILSFVTPNTNGGGGSTLPTVSTYSASNISINSATLNGNASSNSSTITSCWFEWGTGPNTYNLTTTSSASCSINGNQNFSSAIYALNQYGTYYYRACAQNSYGQSCGNILSFSATNNNYYPPAPYYPPVYNPTVYYSPTPAPIVVATNPNPTIIYTTSGSGTSYVELSVSPNSGSHRVGDQYSETISYKNISGRTLSDAVLHITIPQDETFISASEGAYSNGDSSLTIDIGTISKGESGQVLVQVAVSRTARLGDTLVTEATLSFTQGTLNSREDAIAYGTTQVVTSNDLGGLALFSGFGFFPHTIWGWLILALLIYIVILIATRIYDERKVK